MKLKSFFETRNRAVGASTDTFVSLKDEAPEWLKGAVRDAHQGTLPNDWIYAECEAACDAFDCENLKDEDDLHEYSDGRVDIYTSEVYKWAAEMCGTASFSEAEEQARDSSTGGLGLNGGVEQALQSIQYFAIDYIAQVMLNAAKEYAGAEVESE